MPAVDRLLGVLLVRSGAAKLSQIEGALAVQAKARADGKPQIPRLGEILVQKGFCTPEQVRAALDEQKKVIAICDLCGMRYDLPEFREGQTYPCKKCGEPLVKPEILPGV